MTGPTKNDIVERWFKDTCGDKITILDEETRLEMMKEYNLEPQPIIIQHVPVVDVDPNDYDISIYVDDDEAYVNEHTTAQDVLDQLSLTSCRLVFDGMCIDADEKMCDVGIMADSALTKELYFYERRIIQPRRRNMAYGPLVEITFSYVDAFFDTKMTELSDIGKDLMTENIDDDDPILDNKTIIFQLIDLKHDLCRQILGMIRNTNTWLLIMEHVMETNHEDMLQIFRTCLESVTPTTEIIEMCFSICTIQEMGHVIRHVPQRFDEYLIQINSTKTRVFFASLQYIDMPNYCNIFDITTRRISPFVDALYNKMS